MINSLFLTNLYEDREVPEAAVKAGQTVSIEASTVEIEERGVKEPIHFLPLVVLTHDLHRDRNSYLFRGQHRLHWLLALRKAVIESMKS